MWSPLYSNPRLYEWLITVRHGEAFNKRLALISKLLKNKRVVELGCGTGRNSLFLNGKYTGFDLKEKFVNYGKKKNRNVHVSDVFDTPLNNCDAILLVDLLHHIPSHKKLLKKISETKKTIVICEPFEMVVKNRALKFILKKLNRWIDSDGINPPVKWYTKSNLQKLFKEFGACKLYEIGGDIIAYYPGSGRR